MAKLSLLILSFIVLCAHPSVCQETQWGPRDFQESVSMEQRIASESGEESSIPWHWERDAFRSVSHQKEITTCAENELELTPRPEKTSPLYALTQEYDVKGSTKRQCGKLRLRKTLQDRGFIDLKRGSFSNGLLWANNQKEGYSVSGFSTGATRQWAGALPITQGFTVPKTQVNGRPDRANLP